LTTPGHVLVPDWLAVRWSSDGSDYCLWGPLGIDHDLKKKKNLICVLGITEPLAAG
jgi:hypothetical protein